MSSPSIEEIKRSRNLHKGQRTSLPGKYVAPEDVSIWEIIKPNIGKDFSRFTVPVFMNEPLCFLQRLSENVQYSELLVSAAKSEDELERMELVSAFALATISSNHKRLSKPFNPLLLETFELERNGVRFLAEQVSHHPPISAVYAESEHYIVEGTVAPTLNFWMTRLIATPHAKLKLTFKASGEVYEWEAPKCTIYNIIMGKMYMNFTSNITVHSSGSYSTVMCFDQKGYYNQKGGEVHVEGYIFEGKKRVRALYGNWTMYLASCDADQFKKHRKEYVKLFNESVLEEDRGPVFPDSTMLWVANKLPKKFEEQFHFTYFTLSLNEMYDGMDQILPPTDSRRRKDMRALEEARNESAEKHKHRLEQEQRKRRSEHTGNVPLWFTKEDGEWKFNGNYWKRDWSNCTDLFASESTRSTSSEK